MHPQSYTTRRAEELNRLDAIIDAQNDRAQAGAHDPEAEAQLAQIAAEANAVIDEHARINGPGCYYYPEQRARIAREIPKHGTPERTTSGFELAAYRMPNGSRFVTLCDGSKETGKAYAAELHAQAKPRF